MVEKARSSSGTTVHLDRLDPTVVVAEQAAAGVELQQRLAHAPILRVEAQELERTSAPRLGAHAEDEGRPEQVLERLALAERACR